MNTPLDRAWAVRILRSLTDWISGCFCKERFYTYGQAHRIAQRMSHRKGRGLIAYRCRFCDAYHIGGKRG